MKKAVMGLALGGLVAPNVAHSEDQYVAMPGLAFVMHEDAKGTLRPGLGFELSVNSTEGDGPYPGGLAQLEFFFNGDIRFALGGQVGYGVGVEGAFSLRFSEGQTIHGFQLAPFASLFHPYVAYRLMFESEGFRNGMAAGIKHPMGSVESFDMGLGPATSGRPYRDEVGGGRLPQIAYGVTGAEDRQESPIAHAWIMAGAEEHAAFGAFLELSVWLERLGAPRHLVEGARQAAHQELGHAESAFAIAQTIMGIPVAPLADVYPLRDTPTLKELALMNLKDGRLNEGVAAREAEMALANTTNPQIREHLDTIVREEREHADLAYAIEVWARETGGQEVGDALDTALACMGPPRLTPYAGESEPEWTALGQVTAAQTAHAFELELTSLRHSTRA